MRRFEPWIGKDYREGFDEGVRLLVLGESHWGKMEWEHSEFTRNVVRKWCFEERDRFFTTIAKLVLGLPPGVYLSNSARQTFWNQVAFYNYVPCIVGPGPRDRPSDTKWALAQEPFRDVVDELMPHAILVLGKELWWHLPEPDLRLRRDDASAIEDEARGYRCRRKDHLSIAMMIQHPSSFGMRYTTWRPRVQELFAAARGQMK